MESIGTDFIVGVIGTLLFCFKNPDKNYKYPVAIFVIGLFVSQIVADYGSIFSGQIVWVTSALGLTVFYSLRFKAKLRYQVVDYLKIPAVTLLVIFPIPFYTLVHVDDGDFWLASRSLTFFILAIIYLYDRWILRPEKMKKKYIIVLVVQSFLILLMIVYSVVQKAEAEAQRSRAIEFEEHAKKVSNEIMKLKQEIESPAP